MPSFPEIQRIIDQNMAQFAKPGVLAVRSGYLLEKGWITDRPAIVVTVENLAKKAQLPDKVGGVPVDVRQATPLERMRASKPSLYARVAALARPETRLPTFAGESSIVTETPTAAAEVEAAALRAPPKPQIDYVPPQGVTLAPVTGNFVVTCHCSPDAGWTTLKDFLQNVKTRLTVGMYDFTSAHILDTVTQALPGKKLTLTLDHPAKNPTADQTDEDTFHALQDTLAGDLNFAWALVRSDPLAPKWIYPTAYHIKVAVRDGNSFWLSSGNWNNSNQPVLDRPDPGDPNAQEIAKHSDRDWHVIVQNDQLAKVFEQFLINDQRVAAKIEEAQQDIGEAAAEARQIGTLALPDMAEPAIAAKKAKEFRRFFPAETIKGTMTIQPVLTPDNYWQTILPLIQSAQSSFDMQTQYIHPSEAADADAHFMALIEAVRNLIDKGRTVRLILSQWQNAMWLERLRSAGIDLDSVKIQVGVHNKGMIIDKKIVALGSHNWSGDGTLRNRDATLIIHSENVAKYFSQIFDHDWENLAVQQVLS